jgi:hypothetical protein
MLTARLVLFALTAFAVVSATPFTPLFINPDGEPALIPTLNDMYGAGGYTRVSDSADEIWAGQASISAIAISSYAGATQRFGFCVICNGADDLFFDPSVTADGVFSQPLAVNSQVWTTVNAPLLRFFNDPTEHYAVGRVYSDSSLNPTGGDHMVTYSITGSPDTFVFGFEDWLFTSNPASDRDYNDLVVQVTFNRTEVLSTPEPATLTLLGVGLLLAVRFGRARRSSQP